ncbi:MAG TPA: anti-sigma factor [Humisphaera sp.]|jgi:hypothetical protein|nr:anti-sigma factor [Humisphaera sp.]
MTCEQAKDLIPQFALGALEPAEATELRAHLASGCPTCEGELAAANAMLEMLPLALPPARPPAGVKERLMMRVMSESTPKKVVSGTSLGWKIGPAIIGLAAGILLTLLVLASRIKSQGDTVALLNRQIEQKNEDIHNLRGDVDRSQKEIHSLVAQSAEMLNLKGTDKQPQAAAQVYVDRNNHRVLFRAEQIQGLAPGKTYELWLVSQDNRKIPMGMFTADENGKAMMDMPMPPGIGPIAMVAVTDEPAGGMPQPTGSFQLMGTAATD